MRRLVRRIASVVSFAILLAGAYGATGRSCSAQDELIERPGPPPLDDLETDENKDGIPDGWYNARDAQWMAEGGAVGPALRSVRVQRARPARAAFEPRLRRRRPQDRGDRPGPLGSPEQTSRSASAKGRSPPC